MDDAMEDPMNSGSMSSLDASPHDETSDGETTREDRRQALSHRPRSLATLSPEAVKAATQRPAPIRDASLRSPNSSGEPSVELAERPSPTGPQDLGPFADQLVAIAEQLRSGEWQFRAPANEQTAPKRKPIPNLCPEIGGGEQRKAFAEMARLAYAKRRKRASVFGDTELFGEPAWDILLDLYIAQAESKPVSVSSACIGSAAPPTTGLRWLGVLAEQGLVQREHDPQDQRRVLVRLTEKALEAMDAYFESSAALQNDRRALRN